MIGKKLAHYEILAKVGSGGMGEVYRARDTKLGRDVALKILPEELAADPQRRARFNREAQSIAALNHPNIVTIHSVEEEDGLHFITMELVDGATLGETIPTEGMSLNRFFELALPLVDAVTSAHSKGVAHRDLKPDNVMIDKEGRLRVHVDSLIRPSAVCLRGAMVDGAAWARAAETEQRHKTAIITCESDLYITIPPFPRDY